MTKTIRDITPDYLDYKFADTRRRMEEGLKETLDEQMETTGRIYMRGSSIRDENESLLYFIVYTKKRLFEEHGENLKVLDVTGAKSEQQEKMFLLQAEEIGKDGILLEYACDSLTSYLEAQIYDEESDYYEEWGADYFHTNENCLCRGAGACIQCNPRLFI